jgi:hypothetical protein
MYAAGFGLKAIAKRLTAEGVPGPRPFVRKEGGLAPFRGWAPSTVRALLAREDYRGVYVWDKSKKRPDVYADVDQRPKAVTEWKRTLKPSWRVVSDELWQQVAARRKEVEATAVRLADGRLAGRPSRQPITNLLAGIAQCGVCGGGLVVETYKSSKGKPRRMHYVCSRRRQNGACINALRVAVEDMHEQVLTAIEDHALTVEAVEAVLALMYQDDKHVATRSLEREHAEVLKRIQRLVAAIELGVDVSSVAAKLRDLDAQKTTLEDEMASARPVPMPPRALVEGRLAEWRRLLRQSVTTGRAVLDRVLNGRIVFHPVGVGYEFTAPTRYDRLFSGLVVPRSVWAQPPAKGTEGIGPADVYYGGEDDVDYGRILEKATRRLNRVEVASQSTPSWNQILSFLQKMAQLREAAGWAA